MVPMRAEKERRLSMSSTKQRLLLVDDHSLLREGLRTIIATTEDLIVCGEAENAEQGLDAVTKLKPDLVVVDISLKNEIDGIELTRRLKERTPQLRILVLSMHEEQEYVANAMAAGAGGYITKTEDASHFLNAVRQVLRGKTYLSEALR
jgi:DNA-binding NarL/FixJ family response regulator